MVLLDALCSRILSLIFFFSIKLYLLLVQCNRLDIFIDKIKLKSGKDEPILSVIDDGHGMEYEEIVKMVSFGHKQPDGNDPDRIGRFGVGFKVASSLSLGLGRVT